MLVRKGRQQKRAVKRALIQPQESLNRALMHRALERASEERAAAAKEVQDLHEKLQVRFFLQAPLFSHLCWHERPQMHEKLYMYIYIMGGSSERGA